MLITEYYLLYHVLRTRDLPVGLFGWHHQHQTAWDPSLKVPESPRCAVRVEQHPCPSITHWLDHGSASGEVIPYRSISKTADGGGMTSSCSQSLPAVLALGVSRHSPGRRRAARRPPPFCKFYTRPFEWYKYLRELQLRPARPRRYQPRQPASTIRSLESHAQPTTATGFQRRPPTGCQRALPLAAARQAVKQRHAVSQPEKCPSDRRDT